MLILPTGCRGEEQNSRRAEAGWTRVWGRYNYTVPQLRVPRAGRGRYATSSLPNPASSQGQGGTDQPQSITLCQRLCRSTYTSHGTREIQQLVAQYQT